MSQIQVLPVDDERVVVDGLAAIFEREADFIVLGRPTNAAEALELCSDCQPDLVLAGLWLGSVGVVAFAQALRSLVPLVRVLVLSARTDDEAVRTATAARADGCLSRAVSATDLVQSARLIAHGQAVYPAASRQRLNVEDKPLGISEWIRLTDREREVLRLVACGATSREIAERLVLSAKTVDNHRSRILEKLQVRNKAEAVAMAIRRGLLEPDVIDHRPQPQGDSNGEVASTSADSIADALPMGPVALRRLGPNRLERPDAARAQRDTRPIAGAA